MKLSALVPITCAYDLAARAASAQALTQTLLNPLHHGGPSSPYFDAPSQANIAVETPSGCIVDQAAYLVRHGSRYPEPGSFAGWQSLFKKIQNTTFTATGPLTFLPSWVLPVDDPAHGPLFLTAHGAKESFELGAQLREAYGFTHGGGNLTVWTAGQQRVVDTATYFLRGYLSQGNYAGLTNENQGTVVILPDSVNYTFANSLTPSASCPNYAPFAQNTTIVDAFRSSYRPSIAMRLNKFLDGLELDQTDVGIMGDLCGFGFVLNGDTRFCDIFREEEVFDYEYAWDLNYYYGSGPGNPIAGATGLPWMKAVSELFSSGPGTAPANSTFTPPALLMGFTHDNDIPPVVAALGLWNASETSPLSPTLPDSRRTFRSSDLVSFRGYIALERLSCGAPLNASVFHQAGVLNPVSGNSTGAAKFVRVRVNRAPIPIPTCTSGPGETCPLEEFIAYVSEREEFVGDFVEVCGLQGVANATSVASFFTNIPDTSIIRTVSADNLPQLVT